MITSTGGVPKLSTSGQAHSSVPYRALINFIFESSYTMPALTQYQRVTVQRSEGIISMHERALMVSGTFFVTNFFSFKSTLTCWNRTDCMCKVAGAHLLKN